MKIPATLAASLSVFTLSTVYADGLEIDYSSLSQLEVIDYVILAGLIIFVLGIIMVALSAFMKAKPVDEDDYEDFEDYENFEDYDALQNDGNYNEESDDDYDETFDDDEDDDDDFEEPIIAEETSDNTEIAEDDSADTADEEAADEETMEPVAESAPEEKEAKAIVSFSGQNNTDVKFVEFTRSATVGRRASNDLIVSDNAVSGVHCELTLEDGSVYIEDMNSTNGTFIGDERISRTELKNGDIVVLGKMKYKVNISIFEE